MSKNPARIMVQGRLAFPVLAAPERFQGQGDPRYSGTILIEQDGPEHKKAVNAMHAAAAAKWGKDKAEKAVAGLTKSSKVALYDGDIKENYDGFAGHMAISAHAKANNPPVLIDGLRNPLNRETQSMIYAGCYVNAIIEFWAQDNAWGKRINAQLCGLQFVSDGDSFSGGRPASADEFEPVEGAEAASGDDFGSAGDDFA